MNAPMIAFAPNFLTPVTATVLVLAPLTMMSAQTPAEMSEARERFHFGVEALRLGDVVGAERSLRASVAIDPAAIHPRLEWAKALLRLDRPDEAATALRPLDDRVVELVAGGAERASLYYRLLAATDAQRGDHESAIRRFEIAVVHAPEDLRLRFQLIGLYRARGDAAAALTHLRAAVEQRPRSFEIQFELGRTTLDLEHWKDAQSEFERAIELAPENAAAWDGLGQALSGGGRYEDAEAAIRRGLAVAPASALLYERLGDVLYERAAYNDALRAYERAIALSGNATQALQSKVDRARETLAP